MQLLESKPSFGVAATPNDTEHFVLTLFALLCSALDSMFFRSPVAIESVDWFSVAAEAFIGDSDPRDCVRLALA